MYRLLARIGDEGKTLNADKVANVEQLLEYGVLECWIALWADVITADIYLNTTCMVLQLEERCATHNTAAHNTASNANVLIVIFFGVEILLNFSGCCRYIEHLCGVGIDAQCTQLCERVTSQLFLFAKFKCHSIFCFIVISKLQRYEQYSEI